MADATFTFTADHTGYIYRGRERGRQGQLVTNNGDWGGDGIVLTAGLFGLDVLHEVEFDGMVIDQTGGALGSLAGYDKTAVSAMLFEGGSAADAEFAESNNTTLLGYIFRCTAWGY